MSLAEKMEEKLRAALHPQDIQIIDQSALHAGHAGAREGGESHYRMVIIAEAFADKSRLHRQRMVNEILRDELVERVHALSLELKAPTEV
ncbi:MAG: BolA family protein [bacterium]